MGRINPRNGLRPADGADGTACRLNTFREVLSGAARWSCECGDSLEWGKSLPDDSIDILVTSPPYLAARTYGRSDVARGLDEWVAWIVEFVRIFSPKVKGLIAINCEGQTRNYRYLPAPFLLAADLHRAGFNLRKPLIFHRVGIPGSGGPDWLRNDYEPIICVTREGRLPWSDNTACGHPPKYGPGGVPSHRVPNGERVNLRRVRELVAGGMEQRAAAREVGLRLKGTTSGTDDAGTINAVTYVPPDIANPGNVIELDIGGGKMGHAIAHENEAPFPLDLPAFFVKSFCPPDGVVCDPFSGSGTTCHAAIENGRRFIGADLRQSQVELCARRMSSVTPGMFV